LKENHNITMNTRLEMEHSSIWISLQTNVSPN